MIYPNTFKLLKRLSKEIFFKENRATLIGGTAIAYHLQHRVSYDLDIAFIDQKTVPTLSFLEKYSCTPLEFDSGMIDNAINEGGDIREYHKRFSIDKIKVDFIVNPSSNIYEKEILENDEGLELNFLNITSLDALFKLKSLLLLDRNKIRDLYDVVYMIRYSDFTAKDILETIKKYRITYRDEDIIALLKSKKADAFDIEFEGIVEPKMDMFEYDDLRNFLLTDLPH